MFTVELGPLIITLISILSGVVGVSYTLVKLKSMQGNDDYKKDIFDLNLRRAVLEEKVESIKVDVKDVKDSVKDLAAKVDEINATLIKILNNTRGNN